MGRPPKVREDYSQDAVTLHRIRRAVLGDERRAEPWREAQAAALLQVIQAFNLDAERVAVERVRASKRVRR